MGEREGIIETWSHREQIGGKSVVLPDGCCDVIVLEKPYSAPTCFVSTLACRATEVNVEIGAHYQGFRLAPGVTVNQRALQLVLQAIGDTEHQRELIEAFSQSTAGIEECLQCLALPGVSVEQAARDLGVSLRTMQRTVHKATGKPPSFWRQLARARRAARALNPESNLAQHAQEFGFADQPHMNREFGRWFVMTPVEFSHRKDLSIQLDARAYC